MSLASRIAVSIQELVQRESDINATSTQRVMLLGEAFRAAAHACGLSCYEPHSYLTAGWPGISQCMGLGAGIGLGRTLSCLVDPKLVELGVTTQGHQLVIEGIMSEAAELLAASSSKCPQDFYHEGIIPGGTPHAIAGISSTPPYMWESDEWEHAIARFGPRLARVLMRTVLREQGPRPRHQPAAQSAQTHMPSSGSLESSDLGVSRTLDLIETVHPGIDYATNTLGNGLEIDAQAHLRKSDSPTRQRGKRKHSKRRRPPTRVMHQAIDPRLLLALAAHTESPPIVLQESFVALSTLACHEKLSRNQIMSS